MHGWVLQPRIVMVLQPLTSRLCLDLPMTDVPGLARVTVVAPTDNSDHTSLSVVISMAQALTNMCVSIKVFLKHQLS